MTSPLGDALFGITVLSGALLCWLGVYCYRQWDEPGVRAFATFTGMLGAGAFVGGIVGITDPSLGVQGEDATAMWGAIAFLTWGVATIPWLVFSLEYTGTYTRIRRRTIALLSAPLLAFFLGFVALLTGGIGGGVVVQLLVTFATMHILFLMVVGIYLIVRTTHEYGHLSLRQGGSLATAGLATFLGVNTSSIFAQEVGTLAAIGAYSGSYVVPAGLLVFAVFRCEMFESTPAAGTIGEEAIARETEDLIFVVDEDDRIIQLNPKAAETFGISQTDPLGEPIQTVLNLTVAELREMDTYELRTDVSRRQLDPEVSPFTDQHGRRLGYIVSLHDVTERELRKQRLEVLNRVLRHNLRNSVDVIKSNAEALDGEGVDEAFRDERAAAIIDSADGLATLGKKARTIDRFVSRSVRETERDLATVTAAVIEDVRSALANGAGNRVKVTVTRPEDAPLVTDWEALTAALESAIENAIEHADESVTVDIEEYETGYRVLVADDGPGIPTSELASLDAGTEMPLQHGSGLGLWQIKWGVTKLNGTVEFETDDGTTVKMTVPDRSAERSSRTPVVSRTGGIDGRAVGPRRGDGQ